MRIFHVYKQWTAETTTEDGAGVMAELKTHIPAASREQWSFSAWLSIGRQGCIHCVQILLEGDDRSLSELDREGISENTFAAKAAAAAATCMSKTPPLKQ